jgi:hypothetical protein
MDYKGYSFRLSGVYKVENNKKLYSLEIYQGEKQIFKTDYIYEDEKRAFKDAKEMINKNRFDTEIIRENSNKENLKNDGVYKSQKINKFANSVIFISIILMIITYVVTAFGISKLNKEIYLFGILFIGFGILMSLIMMYWGVLTNGGFELNDKQRRVYSIMWWINLLFNKGPIIPYNEQPFKDKQKGWYSSSGLIALFIQSFFAIFLIVSCITNNNFGLTFYGVVLSYILLFINYIFSIVWEISDAKIKGEDFPFKRVITPILTIIAIVAFAYVYIKIFGIY